MSPDPLRFVMPLRVRLVVAVLTMTAGGLALFAVVTTSLYSSSQYSRIDDQMSASAGVAAVRITNPDTNPPPDPASQSGATGSTTTSPNPTSTSQEPTSTSQEPTTVAAPPQSSEPGQGSPDRRDNAPPFSYAQLRTANGTTIIGSTRLFGSSTPELPKRITADTAGRFFDVASESGPTQWRVFVQKLRSSQIIIVAQPLTNIESAVNRLMVLQGVASVGLLIVLGVGTWLILRRGLRPLETMAVAARSISAGSLHERVSPSDDRTEIGELGLALNTMLTEIELAFGERDKTEHRLRQFLADASHELRTPLTSIQGFAELFQMGADQDRERLEVIFRRISDESARMRNLVEDLLLLARLDEVRPYERGAVDLAVLCADACTDAKATAPGRPIALDAPFPVVVSGVGDHLRQAIANLISNALHHTPEGTAIEVSTHLVGDQAVVSVRDHGPGLSDDALAHVFDRFWQADAARVSTGSGLGLSIVAGIADEHGGTVGVTNDPDGGARFTITMPVAPATVEMRPSVAADTQLPPPAVSDGA